ncbi:MAG: AraC family transcriptional regulator [Oscillospiraceae bacterium]|nr:AraC family transcriptional regulator [Oscillospiraceae bacterium]
MEITENNMIELTNVLSFRGKITQRQAGDITKQMKEIVDQSGAVKNGPMITATHSIDTNGAEPLMDIEMMIPLDRAVTVSAPFQLKPLFRLCNAVKIRHQGNPEKVQNTAKELMEFIQSNKLTPVTPGYNVTMQEPKGPEDMDNLIIDMYVGVSYNIL